MRVTDEQYELFREVTSEAKDKLQRIEYKIGDVPMTIRFLNTVQNILSDVQQMYYEEIKDQKDKAFDSECARKISEVHGYMRGVE